MDQALLVTVLGTRSVSRLNLSLMFMALSSFVRYRSTKGSDTFLLL